MCTNMPFKIYTENKYMWALSLAIAYSQKYRRCTEVRSLKKIDVKYTSKSLIKKCY